MKKRFTEEQIAYAFKRHETGIPAKDICREMGVSEEENRQLKRLVADLSLDKHML